MLIYFLILLGAALRVLPHPANFTPIAATALFGAVYLKNKKLALFLPLAAMIVSDVFIGFDSLTSRLVIYGSFLLIGLIGLWIRPIIRSDVRSNDRTQSFVKIFTIVGGSLVGSTLFYLITNLVWFYPAKMYPHTIPGQIASYTNALPFFRYTLAGDLFYVTIFFGIYEAVKLYDYKSSRARARA